MDMPRMDYPNVARVGFVVMMDHRLGLVVRSEEFNSKIVEEIAVFPQDWYRRGPKAQAEWLNHTTEGLQYRVNRTLRYLHGEMSEDELESIRELTR